MNIAFFIVSHHQSKGQDIVQRSVLGPVLPEAMVCYLENYDAERISEIFLGEFDTPEAIWSSEMRYTLNFFCSVAYKIVKFKIKLIILSVSGGWWLKRLLLMLLTSAPGCRAIHGHSTSTAPFLWSTSHSWTMNSSATSTTSDICAMSVISLTGPLKTL